MKERREDVEHLRQPHNLAVKDDPGKAKVVTCCGRVEVGG